MYLYNRSVFFLVISIFLGCVNDVLTRMIGQNIPIIEIIFFRFFIGVFITLPLLLTIKNRVINKNNILVNIFRSVLGVTSFYMCSFAIMRIPLIEVTTILWSIPLFTVLLSFIFLKEKIAFKIMVATFFGFIGILLTMYSDLSNFSIKAIYLIPFTAALLFALQDVIIKKMTISQENEAVMILLFSLIISLLTLIPTICSWVTPSVYELVLLILLGTLSTLMQYFIFLSFKGIDLSKLAPVRYTEFIFQALAGFIFFSEIPGLNVLIGIFVLIPSTLYIVRNECV